MREPTARVTLEAETVFAGRYRSAFFDQLFPRTPASAGLGPEDERFIAANVTLRATLDGPAGVRGVLALATAGDAYGAERHRLGDNAQVARFREGYVALTPALFGASRGDALEVSVGIRPWRLDTRRLGTLGHPFLVDLLDAENPFTGSPGLPAQANGLAGLIPFTRNTFLGGNAWWNTFRGQPRTTEAGGARTTWRAIRGPDAPVHVDVDVMACALLEAGDGTDLALVNVDVAFGAADPAHELPARGNLVNVVLAGFAAGDAVVGSAGAGADAFLFGQLVEVFAEFHWQRGEYVDVRTPVGRQRSQQHAFGGYAGARLQAPWVRGRVVGRPWLEVSAWYLSGDDGNAAEDNRDFLSLENVNQTLILEASDTGLDLDTNYRAWKVEAGATVARAVEVSCLVGGFRLNARPKTTPRPSPSLGIEVDVRLRWRVLSPLSVTLAVGRLQGADFFADMGRADSHAWAGSLTVSARL